MKQIIYMNMTGIYNLSQEKSNLTDLSDVQEEKSDLVDSSVVRERILDFTDLSGVQGYCSDEAAEEILRRISSYPANGIHLLDSGNYHYLSKFWLEKIEEPFDLLVLDHHTDMQRSAFGEILSCGSWILSVIENNPFLNKVYLAGADYAYRGTIDPVCEGRYVWVEGESMLDGDFLSRGKTADEKKRKIPLYISIDKDVLAEDELKTDWDQGNMTLDQMLGILNAVKKERRILGMDICGEPEAGKATKEDLAKSRKINEAVCGLF